MAVQLKEQTDSAFRKIEIKPQLLANGKKSTRLVQTDILSMGVQVVANGGETNLHAHNADDAIWLVLGGRAKFYTTDNEVVGDLGKNEALFISRGSPYWFESSSEENLVILRIAAKDKSVPDTRNDVGKRTFAVGDLAGVSREVTFLDKHFGDD